MYKILIDTTDRKNRSVTLQKADKLVDTIAGELDIVAEVEKMLKKHKLAVTDVSEIIPKQGPGSFTGLKMGFTVANVFNWALGRRNLSELAYPEYGSEPNINLKKEYNIGHGK